jgi:hypothetical protein
MWDTSFGSGMASSSEAICPLFRLRRELPLQRIRTALGTLQDYDLAGHPSSYQLVTDSKNVFLVDGEGASVVDLVKRRGQTVLLTMADVFAPYY